VTNEANVETNLLIVLDIYAKLVSSCNECFCKKGTFCIPDLVAEFTVKFCGNFN
jgi:hypothetical protein